MSAVLPRNSAMTVDLPKLQFAWDSTSMGALKTCPRYYQYAILEGWVPRNESVHLKFGAVYHSALELYERLRVSGTGHEDAVADCVKMALDMTWERSLGKPWISDHPQKNRYTLIRSIIWYLDQFQDDNLKTLVLHNGKPAVELSFRVPLDHTLITGDKTLWCGHLDRVVEWDDNIYIVDHKTTTSTINPDFFDKFSPDNQFTGYTFAGRVIYQLPVRGIVVNGVQVAVTFSRFQRQIVYRSEDTLEEWYKSLGEWFALAERFAEKNFWPMNEKACGNYGGCPYRSVCSKSPKARDIWLKADFSRRVWDPLVTREV